MGFEWDEAKSERERGFGYDAAALIFEAPVIEWCDVREEWNETRIVAVGSTGGGILAVIYTDRGDVRRIISARRARRKECRLWQSLVNP
jgi:uncharacterized DUF497 family protein